MKESSILKSIWLSVSQIGVRLFRNNVGTLKDRNGQYVTYGLCKGSADLIGWKSVEVTREMLGNTVAIFVAIEVKQPGKRATKEQIDFLNAVHRAGGIANVCCSAEDALITLK